MQVLCFDVGGTNTKYALMNEEGKIIEKGKFPSRTDTMDNFLDSIKTVYYQYASFIDGVSFSMPGVLDPRSGYFYTGGAFDLFIHHVNMKEIFSSFIDKRIEIANDAKCAAYGELGYGCLKDVKDAVVMVLGTGIGGCLIKDREVIYGKHLMAGEFSFVNLSSSNDLEDIFAKRCGVDGLLKRVRKELNSEDFYTGEEIFSMAKQGNQAVLKALHDFCYDLASQIYNLQMIFDPEVFAIGGGISNEPFLFQMIDKCLDEVLEYYGPLAFDKPEVRACAFNNDANLIGALYRFLETGEDKKVE